MVPIRRPAICAAPRAAGRWSTLPFVCEELLLEPIEQVVRSVADTGVDRRRLDDGAARRGEPVEALAGRELGDGSGGFVAIADAGHGFEVLADEVEVGGGPERENAGGVDADAGSEVFFLAAVDDHGSVDELLPLDAGHHAENGVIKRGGHGRGSPPVRKCRLRPAGE